MIKQLIKYRAFSVTILVLVPLLFWFLYSELGQYTIEKEHPVAQDYCEIVKILKAENGKAAVSDFFKLKVQNSFCLHCIDEKNILSTTYNKLETEYFYSPQKTNKIYISNSTFLI